MISRTFIYPTILVLATLFSAQSQAQSSNIVHPAISTHNYKHANKAAEAARLTGSAMVIKVSNGSSAGKTGNPESPAAPKYATRAAALVIRTRKMKEKANINPLISKYNYKTQGDKQPQPEENWISGTI